MANSQQMPDNANGKEINEILDLLKNGEENVEYGTHKDVILILGNTGSGKSTFTQYIAGNDDNLISQETEEEGEFLIIDNNNKISSDSTITSKTIFPELVLDKKASIAFYDCPGFSDTRSAAHDISSTYFIKRIIDSANAVKLIFTVNYPSVKRGVDRQDFMLLVKHVVSMVKNLIKLKDSIALIVTKVDNRFVRKGKTVHLVSDKNVIKGVTSFLKQVKKDITKLYPTNTLIDQQFYKNAIKFINILLTKDNQKYTKIGIFRRPDESGILSNISLLQDNKRSLAKVLDENIQFTAHDEGDFGYTISSDSHNYVHGLVNKINENIASDIVNIGQDIQKYYHTQEEQSHDIQELHDKFRSGYDSLLAAKIATTKFVEPQYLIKQITKNINDLNISLSSTNLLSIINYSHYLKFIKTVSDQTTIKQLEWAQGFADIVEYLNNSYKWYSFLINLHIILSEYKVQQDISKYVNIVNDFKNEIVANGYQTEQTTRSLQEFLDKVSNRNSKIDYNNIKDIKLDKFKLKILNELIDSTLKYNVISSCNDEVHKLVIKGQYVKLSDVANKTCPQLKFIEIFALNKVFIDSDLNEGNDQVQLSIIAPTWEIIGSPKIILDGRSGKSINPGKARNGIGPGSAGRDGIPGLQGGPAGNFLGIGQTFNNGQYLNIFANGGKGGPGQHGGDGVIGIDGQKPPIPKTHQSPPWSELNMKTQVKVEKSMIKHPLLFNYIKMEQIIKWYIYGKNCTNGGNGGNGGIGGNGGNEGDVRIIELNEDSKIVVNKARGESGIHGTGGNGKKAGANGQLLIIVGNKLKEVHGSAFAMYYTVLSQRDFPQCKSGKSGITGRNIKGIEVSKAEGIAAPAAIINDFKSYVRENLIYNIKESFLRDYITRLENDKSVAALYDTIGFVNELQRLEDQFYKLHNTLPFLPFYKSLLHRMRQYVDKLHNNGHLTEEYKKVLSYLYAATLSKICSINNSVTNNLFVELKEYLNLVIYDINKLKEFSDVVLIDEYNKKYQEVIIEKTNEAENFINTQITPEINNILSQIEYQIELLIDETITLEKTSKEEKEKLIKQHMELKDALLVRKLLGVITIASQFLGFLGPVGAAAGAVIGGTVMIAESVMLDDTSSVDLNNINTLPNAVKISVTRVTDQLKNKQVLLKEQLHDVGRVLDEFLEKQPSDSIKELKNKIKETKENLNKEIAKESILDPETVDKMRTMRKELGELIENHKSILEKENPNIDINIEKQLRMLNHVQHVISITDVSKDLYGKIKNHEAKIDKLGVAIKVTNDKIIKLAQYEENIYNIIIPACRDVENSVTTMANNLNGKSHIALDIQKWQIQSILKDVKLQMQKMTKGFNVQEDLTNCIDKLAEGMSIMINVYNRIEDYHDKAELAAYIANINSNKAIGITVKNRELNDAIDSLKLIIQTNLVLEKYEIAMNAFRQNIFPFADLYLTEFNYLSFLQSNDNKSLVLDAVKKIEYLKSKISESTITINKYDKYIHSNVIFQSKSEQTSPFFVWKYNKNKHTISKLLAGEEITIKADVTQGVNKNAIKFNVVGIRFKLINEKMQHEMDKQLEDFEVTMIHLGNSYYRCDNKFDIITSNNQTISYSFQNKENGGPLNTNLVYDKIKSSIPVLSPYTMWSIKLTNINNNFSTLAKYKSEAIDLELEGRGQYVDRDINVCNYNLNKYYTLDDTISEIFNIDVYKQKNVQELVSDMNSDTILHNHNNHERSRRSVDEQDLNRYINESSFATSGSCSNIKSSFVNNILNLMSNSLLTFKNLNPVNQIARWFIKDEKDIDLKVQVNFADNASEHIKLVNIQSLYKELSSIPKMFTDNDSSTNSTSNIVNSSLICNHGNLLLLDLLIRWKSGIKRKNNGTVVINNPNFKYALSLAYKEYAPKDMLSTVANKTM